MTKNIFAVSMVLIFLFSGLALAQVTIKEDAESLLMENDWLIVTITKNHDVLTAGSITSVYDKRRDQTLSNDFVNVRWLELFSKAELITEEVGTIVPDKMRVQSKGQDFVVLRASRFINRDTNQPFPIRTDIKYSLERNRLYVHFNFFFKGNVILQEPIRTASFLDPENYEKVQAWNWTRKNHLNSFVNLNNNSKVTYSTIIQPSNQVRFSGSIGAVDFHSTDTALDHTAISKVLDNWIFFTEFMPTGVTCSSELITHEIPKGTAIHKTVAILVNNPANVTIFQNAGQPSAFLSTVPYGGTNLMVNIVEDLPTMTFAGGDDYFMVPLEGVTAGIDYDQFQSFMELFPAVKADLGLIFDSMLTVTQESAEKRLQSGNTDFIVENGANEDQTWRFHNADKSVADSGSFLYHQWLQEIESNSTEEDRRLDLVNSSYHVVRLQNITVGEWEEDASGEAPPITKNYIVKTLAALEADAKEIGISVPSVFRPPFLAFDQRLVEPLFNIGTRALVVCRNLKYPHPLYTFSGEMIALYQNWAPTDKRPKAAVVQLMKKGWPILGIGRYFNGKNHRYNVMVSTFNRILQLYPETRFLLAEEYQAFLRERFDMEWIRENFDVESGVLTIVFRGKNTTGQTFVVNLRKRTTGIEGTPQVDGMDVASHRLHLGKVYVVLPELADGVHKLEIELY